MPTVLAFTLITYDLFAAYCCIHFRNWKWPMFECFWLNYCETKRSFPEASSTFLCAFLWFSGIYAFEICPACSLLWRYFMCSPSCFYLFACVLYSTSFACLCWVVYDFKNYKYNFYECNYYCRPVTSVTCVVYGNWGHYSSPMSFSGLAFRLQLSL